MLVSGQQRAAQRVAIESHGKCPDCRSQRGSQTGSQARYHPKPKSMGVTAQLDVEILVIPCADDISLEENTLVLPCVGHLDPRDNEIC